MGALGACLALGVALRAGAAFLDVTESAGLSYLQQIGHPFSECLLLGGVFCTPERMSGGAAVADVDGDGDLDLVATRMDAGALLFCNRLVETGQAVFEDCTSGSGLDAAVNGNGAAFGDLDGDGDPDLYVSAIATTRFYLFVNDGAGHFTEEGAARGAAVETAFAHMGTSVEIGDYDGDGWLDIHVDEWGAPTLIYTPGGVPDQPVHMRLLRNRGAAQPGFFDDVTVAAGVVIPADEAWGFSSAFRDLDGDGRLDLAIASDFGTSKLFWNDGDGTFTEGGAAAGVATDENGMGSTFGDLDGDGNEDWFVTSIYGEGTCPGFPNCFFGLSGNRFYRNDGNRHFSDQTGDAATGLRDGGWGWGAAFFDFDLDGDLDLVMTNGLDDPANDHIAAYHDDPMKLWRNDGAGVWSEVAAAEGVTDTRSGKGLLVFDYDADGDLDLFVVNDAATPVLYQNQAAGPGGPHWLRVRVVDAAGADALGAQVTITPAGGAAQRRTIGSTTQFLAWSDPAAHFGLGADAVAVDVDVQLPGAPAAIHRLLAADALDRTLVVPEPGAASVAALGALLLVRLRRRG